ncbi:unnamed protein product [Urochloa humidicola]
MGIRVLARTTPARTLAAAIPRRRAPPCLRRPRARHCRGTDKREGRAPGLCRPSPTLDVGPRALVAEGPSGGGGGRSSGAEALHAYCLDPQGGGSFPLLPMFPPFSFLRTAF